MIIESGVIIFLGMAFIFWKLPRRTLLQLLNYPLALDIGVSALVYVLHWGTFSGVMAAAVAGMMTSGMTSFLRWWIGYIAAGVYKPGQITLKNINPC